MLELERVFLVRRLPGDLNQYDYANISQHYLRSGLRLRKRQDFRQASRGQYTLKDFRFELAKKHRLTPGNKTRREETTIVLQENEYRALRPTAVRWLKKDRYFVPLGKGLTAELDVFEENLRGLIWVEVEFPDDETMEKFEPPEWFGREISNEEWASSSWVAGRSFEEIRHLVT